MGGRFRKLCPSCTRKSAVWARSSACGLDCGYESVVYLRVNRNGAALLIGAALTNAFAEGIVIPEVELLPGSILLGPAQNSFQKWRVVRSLFLWFYCFGPGSECFSYGGYIGFGCIAIAAYGMAIGEVLKRKPRLGAYLPSFLTSRNWRFVPAIFFTLGIIIWIGSEYIPAWSHSDQHEDCSNSIIERLNINPERL